MASGRERYPLVLDPETIPETNLAESISFLPSQKIRTLFVCVTVTRAPPLDEEKEELVVGRAEVAEVAEVAATLPSMEDESPEADAMLDAPRTQSMTGVACATVAEHGCPPHLSGVR